MSFSESYKNLSGRWHKLTPRDKNDVVFAGQKAAVERPRVRTRQGEEVQLDSYARLQHDGRRQRAVREGIVAGLTSRNYHRAVDSVLSGYGIEKSSVSRQFVAASAAQLKKLCEKKLDDLDPVAILIDGIHLGKQVLVVALGIESSGKKQVLGLWQGATENTTVVKELLEDLVARGLDSEKRYLFVIDGARLCAPGPNECSAGAPKCSAARFTSGGTCKSINRRAPRGDTDRRIRNAYAMTS
ncbi:MAG TPA: transposase [Candidatus Acidoferrales bacterium]|nr:transposase [Candidatus Acidoferrales bacterium]